jgi:CRP/FNR family transcriptional regulator
LVPAPVRDLLARLPHFRGLPDALLDAVLATASTHELSTGDTLFREGDRCDGFFVVVQGRIKIYRLTPDGREQVVHDVGEGRTFAEAALFHHGRFPAWGAALESPTVILKLDGPRFLELFGSQPELAGSMVGSLCTWLHTLLDRIETLSIVSAGARLAHHLLRLPARDQGDHVVVTLELPKKDLASELSITPETLSRLFGRWRDRGWASVDGSEVTLRDLHALQALADSGAG